MIRWPSATRQRTQRRSVSAGARTTTREVVDDRADDVGGAGLRCGLLAHARSPSRRSTSSSTAAAIAGFGAFATCRSPARVDEHDLVLVAVEADVVASHVVVDDEIGVLAGRASRASAPGPPARAPRRTRRARRRSCPLAERRGDVDGRLELDRPRRRVLRPLVGARLGRAVVGDRGRHQRSRPRPRARAPRARRPPRSASGRPRPRPALPRRGSRRAASPRPSPPGFRGERDAHPARTSGCRRSAPRRAARVSLPRSRARASRRARFPNRRATPRPGRRSPRARSSARAPLALGELARPRGRSLDAAGAQHAAFACVAGCAHIRWFIAGATSTGPRCASAASVSTSSASPCASFASVFAVSGATTSRSARSRCG